MGPKQGIFGRKWLLRPKILVSADNPFGRFTVRGTYCRKPFGRNLADNYGRYNGRKLFRSHTIIDADLALSQSQLNEGTEGSMAAWDDGI